MQTLDNWYTANKKHIMTKAKSMFFNCNAGILTITCPDDSKIILTREEFKGQDLIACYATIEGKTVFSHYEQDSIPAFSHMGQIIEGVTA
jgi:hypothetical protein